MEQHEDSTDTPVDGWNEIGELIDGEDNETALAYWLERWEGRFPAPKTFEDFLDLVYAANERVNEMLDEKELFAP